MEIKYLENIAENFEKKNMHSENSLLKILLTNGKFH